MITLPVTFYYKDIAVYPDTDNCNKYYCLRTTPHIRLDESGEPIFKSVFWSGAKSSDETTMGFSGGKINFDTNLAITVEEEEEIKNKIIAGGFPDERHNLIMAREEKRRNLIKAVAGPSDSDNKNFIVNKDQKSNAQKSIDEYLKKEEETAQNQIPSPAKDIDGISFGEITFTSGRVDINEQNGGSLVEWANDGGKPALFGDNNRATALQLTPLGAALFYQGITQRTQAISISYDLKLQMAMPALDIRIYAGSVQTASIQKHFIKGDKCKGTADTRKISEMLTDMGFINIDIDRKSTNLDDEMVNKIRDSMMSILDKKVEEVIKTKIAPLTPEERESKSNFILEEEFRSFTELTFSESSVFEFNIAPQATICDFFKNVTDEQLEKMITLIDLTNEVFSFKEITLCSVAPWNEKPFVNLVKVECEYPSLPEGNKDRIKSFMFDKNTPTAEWSFMKPKTDDGTIKYTPYVYLSGGNDCIQLPTQTSTGNYIIVNVGKIGVIDVAFHAHPNVVNLPSDLKVTGIQIDLWYDDAKGNHLMGPEQILISDLNAEVKFEKNLGVVIDQPLHYKTTYHFKNTDSITLGEKFFYITDTGTSPITTEFPFKNRKTIQVELPFVPDENVKDINGEIYYGKYTFPIDFSKDDEWEPVKVNLCSLDETIKEYSYKFYLKYENNEYDMITSGVIKGDSDTSTLIVPLKRIEMAGIDMLDLGEKYYRANIQIKLPDGFGNPIEFHLSKKDKDLESKVFYVFCPEGSKLEINWTLNLYDMEGQEMSPVTGKTEKTFFILTPPKQ